MAEIGITGIGVHIPRYRLAGELFAQVWGGAGSGERAVANYDEDSLTMAVEASLAALEGRDARALDAVFFASTTPPYAEKSCAVLLATVADCGREVMAVDLGGSLRAGTTALRLALDAVRAGSSREALVAAADLRAVAPGSELEPTLGEGAAAVLLGSGEVLATYEGGYGFAQEFSDVWRKADERFLQAGDPTFVRAWGYERLIPEAVAGLLARTGLRREEIAKVVPYAPDARLASALLLALGFPDDAALKIPLLERVGNAGCASPLLGLAAALEEAAPGDRILVVGYGSGADALLFRATGRVRGRDTRRGVAAQLARGRPLRHYGKYLRFRRLVETEVIKAFTGLPVTAREEAQALRLHGQRCRACGAVQYPRRHLCWSCSGKEFEEHRLSRRGKVFTFTKDHLVPSPDPPVIMVAADLEGGGRFYTQLTDCDPAEVGFEMPVELTFRRFHEGGELANYFWKFRPALGWP